MQIKFDGIYWLLLAIPILAFLIWQAKEGQFASSFQKKVSAGLRCIICFLLIFALSGISVGSRSNQISTVFLLDQSASIADDGMAETFLQDAQKAMGGNDQTSLLLFGKNASVESSFSADLPTDHFVSYVDKNGTDIAGAMDVAQAMFPNHTAKRAVLLSDGNETTGNALQKVQALAQNGVMVDVYPLQSSQGNEVQISSLELPRAIDRGTAYEITLRIWSNCDQTVTVRLYKGQTMIAEEAVQVHSGENPVVFTDTTDTGGAVVYRGEITAPADTISENNQAYAYTYITDVPHILILERNNSGENWASILSSAQVAVERKEAGSAPATVDGLHSYDGVVLADVAVDDLPEDFLTAVEEYVRTTGGGLLVSGGENAYALGGYHNTLLEEILPVDMELETEAEEANLGMVFVIDHSGSMASGNYGVSSMDMAKEAVIRSLENFGAEDYMAVVAFDSLAEVAVPFQKVKGNEGGISETVSMIQPAGGTTILPALQKAYDILAEADTKEKHIILLTDGQAEQNGYDSLLRQMKENGITLSTVAVGSGADIKLMERLAETAGGRYYFTNEFTDLPKIFAKETILAGEEYLKQHSFFPQAADASAILSGIQSVPVLNGYVGTSIKPRADQVLVSDEEDPILAAWQYGLGRTVAWTSDAMGMWTEEWLADGSGAEILRNAVGWMMKSPMSSDISLTAQTVDGNAQLELTMPVRTDVKEINATIVDSKNESHTVAFSSAAPGTWRGLLDTDMQGAYVASLTFTLTDGSQENESTGFVIGYPDEYDMTKRVNGTALLQQLAEAGGGRVLQSGSDVFSSQPAAADTTFALRTPLLIVAMILFLLDIAFYRFSRWFAFLERKTAALADGMRTHVKKGVETVRQEPAQLNQAPQKGKKVVDQREEKEKQEPVQKSKQEKTTVSTAQMLAQAKKKRDRRN